MIKLYSYETVFREVPGEVTLALNLSNCPHHCKGCHSPWLWNDEGTILDKENLINIINGIKKPVTCIAFMGGDNDINALFDLNYMIHEHFPDLKTCWYTGSEYASFMLHYIKEIKDFDYIKFGPYVQEKGGLDSPNTNQAFFKIDRSTGLMTNITKMFQNNGISVPIER